ncbi:MAG TPA: PspC domain-containing protein [Solirubrobacteraceae bacterium]|nr:PspC domain-containing protein [Solirubrobacteraceae bacterium]
MNDAITVNAPGSRLERPLQGRLVTGVCAGLARHFGIDVTLVRIVVVVASFLGGAGVILYVAATLLVPEEGQEQPLLRGAPRRGRSQLLLGAALVAIGAANVLGDVGLGFGGHTLWGAVMLAVGAFFLMRTQELRDGIGDDAGARRDEPATAAGDPPAAAQHAAPHDTAATVAVEKPQRRGARRATLIVLGGVLVATAAAVALLATLADDASWQAIAGSAVLVAGSGIAAGSLLGASPWLLAPVLLATAGAMALQSSDVDLGGGIGTRAYRPVAAADVPDRYHLGIGELNVDLRDTALPRGRTVVHAKLGIGDLAVRVPRGASVRVVAHAGAGEIRLLGDLHDGSSVDAAASVSGPSTRTVVIDADVGFGAIDVVAADSPLPNDDHDWSRR